MALRDVLLLSNEPATVQAVGSALESNGQLTGGNVFRNLADVALRLERGGVPAVLVDIDEQPPQILSTLEPLIRRFSETKFLVLSGVMRSDLLLEAMQVGVRHFLLKDSVPAELALVLHRLCPDTPGGKEGTVITVLSAGGGCGATTVAVNLAAELQSADKSNALIVDLDPAYGAVGAYFGMDGEYGAYDLLRRTGSLDGQLVQSTSVSLNDNLQVLLSTTRRRLGEPVLLEPARLGEAIDACRRAYRWSVVDAPRITPDAAGELAKRSSAVLLLLQMTVKDIHVARQMLIGLNDRGVAPGRVFPLATRYRKRGQMITLEEASKALGLKESQTLGTLSNDYNAVTEAMNLGKPLAQTAPRSDFRRDLQKLAGQLAVLPAPVAAATRSALFVS